MKNCESGSVPHRERRPDCVVRNRPVHRAYLVWVPIFLAGSVTINLLWDTPWWHATARQIIGV